MTALLDVSNFEKICRVCTRIVEELTSITLYNIIEMIKACTTVEIFSTDELPHQICKICLNQLRHAFDFKNLCEKSDFELRQIYENALCKPKKEELDKEGDVESVAINVKPEAYNFSAEDYVKKEQKWSESQAGLEEQLDGDLNNRYSDDGGDEVSSTDTETDKDEITEHQKIKRKTHNIINTKFQCDLCEHSFVGVWRLGLHMKKIHQSEGKKCDKCSLICYHELHLQAHEKSHIEKQFTCDICNKSFISMRKLKKHKIAHSTDRPYHCTQCDKSFKEKCVLTQHIKKIHINPDPHEVCQICGKSVGKASLERHLTIHDNRSMFPCSECPKKFYKEISLTKHFRRVHKNEALQYMYLCNICGRGLLSKAELRRHLCTHTGEKPFECTTCDKKYNDRGALRRHIKSAHLDERPFSCSVCSRAFHTKIILQNHMRKHTGERPFQCLICSKSFGFKTVLQQHMKVHS